MTEEQAKARVEEIVTRLRAQGHRLTPQRLAVVRALVGSSEHPSAEQVYQRLQPEYPMMSPATVYKTIDTLKALDEVLELEFRDGPNRYDANIPNSHPHLMCTGCGRIDDLEIEDIDRLAQPALAQSGYQVLRHRLDFYGICPSCGATAV
jgi:Fur family transcriptional regulator, peroxide stress response regulator